MRLERIFVFLAAASIMAACVRTPEVEFGVDTDELYVPAEGGVRVVNLSIDGQWVASTSKPWITFSPANGKGSMECKVSIDSTLLFEKRRDTIRIQNVNTLEIREFYVEQDGFEHQITLKNTRVDIEDFAEYDKRYFEVEVMANVEFDAVLSEEARSWLSFSEFKLDLDRGARPRRSVIRFDWKVNSRDYERIADVVFVPKNDAPLGIHEGLKVVQKAAQPIPVGTHEGDSLALIAINRALGGFAEWDTSERLEHWDYVKLDENGRVKGVQFFLFKTKEPIPYEVQYLTAAEELIFFSNANHQLNSLDTGEWITKLTQLKRLTISAYGLTSLHPDFVNLKNLEYLNLSSNCFQEIPDMLTPDNFPNLHSLHLNASRRNAVSDLSNDIREDIGGFVDDDLSTEKGMRSFKRLLKWEKLDTIRLSINYLQGELPDMRDEGLECWTFEELKDSLDVGLTELPENMRDLPKVLPNATYFAINGNRLSGKIPDWMLYHPKMDLWIPFSLVFPQDGKDRKGTNAGFDNEPASLEYYYEYYVNKKYNTYSNQE